MELLEKLPERSLDRIEWFRKKYPPCLVEAMAANSVLKELGYKLDEVQVSTEFWTTGVVVRLNVDGKKAYILAGEPVLDFDELQALSVELVKEWADGSITNREKSQLYASSSVKRRFDEIVTNLKNAGFSPQ